MIGTLHYIKFVIVNIVWEMLRRCLGVAYAVFNVRYYAVSDRVLQTPL